MTLPAFTGYFSQQAPIPDGAIVAAGAVMGSGRLHCQNPVQGEAVALEQEHVDGQGALYCIAAAPGGQSMQIALRAAGGKPGDAVQTNSIALAPVPGAGSGVGARSLVARLAQNGVDVKWVGAAEPAEFMSSHRCWRYTTRQESPVTDEILAGLFDMRLPLTFGLGECDLIADHILQQVALLGAQA